MPRDQRRPFFAGLFPTTVGGYGGAFGWTQDIEFFCNCGAQLVQLAADTSQPALQGWLLVPAELHVAEGRAGRSGGYFFYDRDLNKGLTDWDRTHTLNLVLVYELPFGKDKKWGTDMSPMADAFLGGWQFNATQTFQSGIPFERELRRRGLRPRCGSQPAERQSATSRSMAGGIGTSTRRRSGPRAARTRAQRSAPSAIWSATALRGPGYRRTDASLFKHVRFGGTRDLELRVEVVNLFNNVNLGNPDTEIGSPGSDRPNAGRINSTAYFNADPQRNFQFAVKFQF